MPATTCKRGHELTPRANGRARCKICDASSARHEARGRHPQEVLLQVPNAPLRERFLELQARGQITAAQVAHAFGWLVKPSRASREAGAVAMRGDQSRVRKELGLMGVNDGGTRRTREMIAYERAVEYANLFKMDYREAGV